MNMKFSFVAFVFLISTDVAALDLQSAVISKGRDTVRDAIQAAASPKITTVVKATGDATGSGIAYTNLGTGSTWYRLYRNMKIYGVNTDSQTFIGAWPLTRTADDSKDEIRELSRANSVGSDETSENSFMMGTEHDALGCLWDTPLRYGDIEQDGQSEIVAIMGRDETQPSDRRLDMVIFSPQKQSVSFSIRLAREDIGGTLAGNFPDYTKLPNSTALPQLISTDMRGIGNPAMRYYAKLFFGDFDKNGTPDIIAWRKRYDSRPVSDPIQGYSLTSQLLTHYTLINGLYAAQTTDEPTIQTWLTDNALTWKKGYPDVSECAADAGKPIPEMSDPLLNDPDVLQ